MSEIKASAAAAAQNTKAPSPAPARARRAPAKTAARRPVGSRAGGRQTGAVRQSGVPRRTAAPVPDVYDELDLPAGAYDELDVPAAKPARKAAAKKPAAPDPYDELDVPAAKPARKAAPKKPAAPDPYDELDAPVAKPARKAAAKKPATPRAAGTAAGGAKARTGKSAAKAPGKTAARTAKKAAEPYDLEPAPKKPAGSGGPPRGGLTLLLAAAILTLLILIGRQFYQYNRFTRMRAAVERQTFYAGTVVDGVDVSGMTLAQAQAHWAEALEPAYAGRTVTFTNGEGRSVTAADLGYRSDYQSVLAAAWDAGRTGTLEERYRLVTERSREPVSYAVQRRFYDEALLDRYVQAAAAALDSAPTEPHIATLDPATFEFTFAEGEPGQALDTEKLARDIRSALEAGGGAVTLALSEVPPAHTVADISADYGLIASAQTNASSSSSARLSNIRLALSTINGVRLQPGETFSFNDTVGQRTTARGYKPAGAYNAGEVVEEVGGGICQVSTTLFNAAVKANLEITERHNHSMPVGYVDKGKDATVNWGGADFKFTNNTDTEVYIGAYLTSDKRVRVGIFGRQLPDGMYITVEATTTGTQNFETVYEVNPLLPPGTQNVRQAGRTGYTAEAYKIVWDKDGNQLSRTLLCKSRYNVWNQIIEVGP